MFDFGLHSSSNSSCKQLHLIITEELAHSSAMRNASGHRWTAMFVAIRRSLTCPSLVTVWRHWQRVCAIEGACALRCAGGAISACIAAPLSWRSQ